MANFAFPCPIFLKPVLLAVKPDGFVIGSILEISVVDVVGASSECESLLTFMVELNYRSSAMGRVSTKSTFSVSNVVDYANYFAYEGHRLI